MQTRGCLGAANVCKKTIKSKLSLKDFPEIVCRNYCCMKFSHAAVLGIESVRSTLVAFSSMYSYGEIKFANVKGYFTDYYHSKGGGCNGCKPNNFGGYCWCKPHANWRGDGVKNPENLQT